MPSSGSAAVFEYLDRGIMFGKWRLMASKGRLDVMPQDRNTQKYQVIYNPEGTLQITLSEIGSDYTNVKFTDLRRTGEANSDAARLMLALTSFMLSTGNIDPCDVANALGPRLLPSI
jgi:hypothetical protein